MTRAVLDTNVYVSAPVFGGKPARVPQLAAAGTFQLIVSESIQAELLETLATRFAWPADRAAEVCARLWDAAHWVAHPFRISTTYSPGREAPRIGVAAARSRVRERVREDSSRGRHIHKRSVLRQT